MRPKRQLPSNWKQPEIVYTYLDWCRERDLAEGTIETYRGNLNRLAYWLQAKRKMGLLHADRDDLSAWRSHLRQGKRTIALYVTTTKCFYRWCHHAGFIPEDPAWRVVAPRVPQGVPRPIATDRLGMVLELAVGMMRLWMVLAAYTGLRAAEIANLGWDNVIDFGDGERYIVIQGKGDKKRIQALSPFVWSELLLFGRQATGSIFRKRDGLAFSPNYLDKVANRWLHENGFWETMHMLRHWYGTAAARATNGDLVLVGHSMGHASTNTTKIYTEPFNPDVMVMVCAIQPAGWPGSLAQREESSGPSGISLT